MRSNLVKLSLWLAAVLCGLGRAAAGEGSVVQGKVTWDGEVPKPVILDITSKADDLKACACTTEEKAKASPRLKVAVPSKGVQNAVVTLEGVAEGAAKAFPEREADLNQHHCEYIPHIVWVEAGKTLHIRNSDNALHNVHVKGAEGDLFNISMPEKDQVIKKKIREPGVYTVGCDAGHLWMNAFVFVVDHPYIAITDDQGNFSIDGVPPGKYKLTFWHEGWQVTPVLDLKSQKPSGYQYSDPLTLSVEVEVKAGAAVQSSATLNEKGFKK